jgi:hypothetical protein
MLLQHAHLRTTPNDRDKQTETERPRERERDVERNTREEVHYKGGKLWVIPIVLSLSLSLSLLVGSSTMDDLARLSIRELRERITQLGGSTAGCIEKSDLVARAFALV